MNVAIILPARLKSTRLPDKLLLEAAGKTILEHTLERAREAQAASKGLITRILVAADDEKLIAIARRAGADAVMTDPNHTSGTDRVAEAAENLKEDVIVNLQADEPEIDPRAILLVVQQLEPISYRPIARDYKSPGPPASALEAAPVGTLATPIYDEEIWLKSNVVKVVIDKFNRALYFSRAPIPFVRDTGARTVVHAKGARISFSGDPGDRIALDSKGEDRLIYGYHHVGIYAYRKDYLMNFEFLDTSGLERLEMLEQLRVLYNGGTIRVGIIESNRPGIDTQADFDAFVNRFKTKSQEPGAKS